jgi:hypothetical protein
MQPGDSASSTHSPSVSTSSLTRSRTSSLSSHTDVTIEPSYPSDVLNAQYSLGIMRGSLEALELILRNLEDKTLQQEALEDNHQLTEELRKLRQGLGDLDKKQTEGKQEIELLMKNLLEEQSLKDLQKQVDEEIKLSMDTLVKEEVEAYLKKETPAALQKELQERKEQLKEAHRDLHNSESKRLNALLRDRNRNEPLHKIYRKDGTVSDRFPKTLDELFNIDAETCKLLVEEYSLPPSSSKDGDLNRFMIFCGVQYQMVRRGNDIVQT